VAENPARMNYRLWGAGSVVCDSGQETYGRRLPATVVRHRCPFLGKAGGTPPVLNWQPSRSSYNMDQTPKPMTAHVRLSRRGRRRLIHMPTHSNRNSPNGIRSKSCFSPNDSACFAHGSAHSRTGHSNKDNTDRTQTTKTTKRQLLLN